MNNSYTSPPQDEVDASMRELLAEIEKEAVPPHLRDLARRLDAALAAARRRTLR